jgi:pSer/pThr/pTyr-binding forkhead associated (FHA) protein
LANFQIEFASGPNAGQVIPLANQTLVFGRTFGSDIVLDWDLLVSSRHCKILKERDSFVLHDLGSTNGTFVNGNLVKSHELTIGDEITLGKTLLSVKEELSTQGTSEFKSYHNPFDSTVFPIDRAPNAIESRGTSRSDSLDHPDLERHRNQDKSSAKKTWELPAGKSDLESAELAHASGAKVSGAHASGAHGVIQVRLRITSEAENGKLFWLNLGQCSTFGRTERSDCSIPSDSSLSSEHFKVTCGADQCTIEDMHSRSGVWLNGKQISKANLHHGDHVKAGMTEFSIEIQGIAGAASVQETEKASPGVATGSKPRTPTRKIYEASSSLCASGIQRLRGKLVEEEGQAEAGIVEFFETVHAFAPMQVLVDFSKISLPLPKEIDAQTHSLFEWLPEGAIEKSPMLFALDELPVWKVFVEEAWGSDAMIGLRSELPRKELLVKFQELLMGSSSGPQSSRGILGFCWPSVLEALIENNSNGFTESFYADVRWVLLEKQDKPEYWQLLGKESEVDKATKLGIQIIKEKPKDSAAIADDSH